MHYCFDGYTGSLLAAVNLSVNRFTGGKLSMFPSIGTRRQNVITTGMKSPNNEKNPNNSKHTPIIGIPINTKNIPMKKNALPFAFFFWKKNRTLRDGPIIKHTPLRNNTFPIASKPFSKKNNTPNPLNATPNAVNPIPIFRTSPNAELIDIVRIGEE